MDKKQGAVYGASEKALQRIYKGLQMIAVGDQPAIATFMQTATDDLALVRDNKMQEVQAHTSYQQLLNDIDALITVPDMRTVTLSGVQESAVKFLANAMHVKELHDMCISAADKPYHNAAKKLSDLLDRTAHGDPAATQILKGEAQTLAQQIANGGDQSVSKAVSQMAQLTIT